MPDSTVSRGKNAAVARIITAILGVVLATTFAAGGSGAGADQSTTPIFSRAATLEGPVTTGHIIEPLSANAPDLTAHGYVEQEYFASGTASAFTATSMPSDGRWTIKPTTSAPYATRILVRRPANPSHFNGTVVVEWMNVSAGESAPDWDYLNPSLMRAGYAYVGVSAQELGVDGGHAILGNQGASSGGLVAEEPARYGTLHHPGDQYALDIYAQIGKALSGQQPSALGGLRPTHVIALGESQSAFYLTTFADALQPRTNIFDGIFIHSRGGGGASLNGTAITKSQGPSDLRIRTDLHVPVFMFETQTDLIALGYAPAQQPNTTRIRTWEVAGTSHADAYEVGPALSLLGCTTPVNNGPQHNVVQAAFAAFNRWVDHGTPPPSPPRFRLAATDPAVLALDAHGNVIGGVRTPAVDVPVSTLSGAAPAGTSTLCSLFGQSTPFTPAVLAGLYHSQADYLAAYRASLNRAIAGGYILAADRSALMAQARQVQIP